MRIVFEPTGPYHRLEEQRLTKEWVIMIRVNPRLPVCRSDRQVGQGRPDRPSLLARMGATLDLRPNPGSSKIDRDLRELSLAGQALIKDRTAAQHWEQVAYDLPIRRRLKARLSQGEK